MEEQRKPVALNIQSHLRLTWREVVLVLCIVIAAFGWLGEAIDAPGRDAPAVFSEFIAHYNPEVAWRAAMEQAGVETRIVSSTSDAANLPQSQWRAWRLEVETPKAMFDKWLIDDLCAQIEHDFTAGFADERAIVGAGGRIYNSVPGRVEGVSVLRTASSVQVYVYLMRQSDHRGTLIYEAREFPGGLAR